MKLGDKGAAVRAWQDALRARGYRLTADGVFGKATHNATLAFQAALGLPTTGEMSELQIVTASTAPSIRPPPVLAHSIPFVASRFQLRSPRAAIELIVLHCMECPESSTRAEWCAQWMSTLSEVEGKKSAHYYVDSDTVVQGVLDHHIAYHAPGANHNGIGIEHASYARQTRADWLDAFGVRMLGLSVQLSARLCAQWNIPAVFVPAADLQLRKHGITTHHEVSLAFGKSAHTDPGKGFPIDWYVERVAALVVAQQGDL